MKNITYIAALFCALLAVQFDVHAQWKKTAGPSAGPVRALCTYGADMYAGMLNGAVYHSNDNGSTWVQVASPLYGGDLWCIMATDARLFVGSSLGLFRSSDKGQTWQSVNDGLPHVQEGVSPLSPRVRSLIMLGGVLCAGTTHGVCTSTDGGDTWTVPDDTWYDTTIDDMEVDGNTLYAVYEGNLRKSLDSAKSWQSLDEYMPAVKHVAREDATIICGSSTGGWYRSTDHGVTWSELKAETYEYTSDLMIAKGKAYASTTRGIVRLSDNKEEWVYRNTGVSSPDVLCLLSKGDTLYAGTLFGGVFRSTDQAMRWHLANDGLASAWTNAIVAVGDTLFAGTRESGMFKSTNGGNDWSLLNANVNDKQQFQSVAVVGPNVFAGSSHTGMAISTDRGETWNWHQSLMDPEAFSVQNLIVQGDNVYATSSRGVFRSTDLGRGWFPSAHGIEKVSLLSMCLHDNMLFVGTEGHGIFRSTDNGATWTSTGPDFRNERVTELFSHKGMLFASAGVGVELGLYGSRDSGANWESYHSGLPNYAVTAFASTGDFLFAAVYNSGVFVSTDTGLSWSSHGNLKSNAGVISLSVSDSKIYAATNGDGVWGRSLTEFITAVDDTHEPIANPSAASSLRVSPNISASSLLISFNMSSAEFVTITLHNVQGQCVATLLAAPREAGPNDVEWNIGSSTTNSEGGKTGGLAAGLYFVQLTVRDSPIAMQPLIIDR